MRFFIAGKHGIPWNGFVASDDKKRYRYYYVNGKFTRTTEFTIEELNRRLESHVFTEITKAQLASMFNDPEKKQLKKDYRIDLTDIYERPIPAENYSPLILSGVSFASGFSPNPFMITGSFNYNNENYNNEQKDDDGPRYDAPPKRKSTVVFPQPATYFLKYRKENGTIHSYRVSAPIQADSDKITVYAFKRGVRSFKKSRVISFERK